MITILDYGLGNLGSIKNMLKHIGVEGVISSALKDIEQANKLILPGVGAFDSAMNKINESGIRKVLDKKCNEGVPILGICLGMQILLDRSEEGDQDGLGWIPGAVKKFKKKEQIKIPHMGWNNVNKVRNSDLTKGLLEDSKFYFVHSFHVCVANQENSILETFHGTRFDSAIQKGNIYGVQFHPEKSHKYGMRLLSDFAEI